MSLDISSLDDANSFVIRGTNTASSSNGAGDVNGDGIDDLMFGSPGGKNIISPSFSYVVFGRMSGFEALELSALDGSNGFAMTIAEGGLGSTVSAAGDVNGDGIADVILGASGSPERALGASYVVFGRASGFAPNLALSTLDGSNGFAIDGDFFVSSVSSAGDVNSDGIADVIVGVREVSASYVVFGQPNGFGGGVDLTLLDGVNGFIMLDLAQGFAEPVSGSGVGDINGDGIDDLIIGDPQASPNNLSRAGSSYVIFGRTGAFDAILDPSALDGSNGFVINGLNRFDNAGQSVSDVGDVNGDGMDDFIIGAPGLRVGADQVGASYVIFGRAGGFGPSLDLAALDGSNGFVMRGIGDSYRHRPESRPKSPVKN